jgi:hypothetical protein
VTDVIVPVQVSVENRDIPAEELRMSRALKLASFAAVLAAAMLPATPGRAVAVIDTLGGSKLFDFTCLGTNGSCGQTFGQIFTVTGSETRLDSFTFRISQVFSAPLNIQFDLYGWGGTDRSGPLLFQSAVVAASNGGDADFSFNPGVVLTSGAQYIAYLDTAGIGNTTDPSSGFPVVDDSSYTGGTFRWERNSGDGTWFVTELDSMFRAEFSSPVPEPAALAVIGLGLAGLGIVRRRRSI